MRIQDRETAGRLLSAAVGRQDLDDPVVVGIGPGGLAVGAGIARSLNCPLDILEVVELHVGDALHPNRAFGALTGDGHVLIHPTALEHLSSDPEAVRDAVRRARSGTGRRADIDTANGHGHHPHPGRAVPTAWRSVVLVDDGTSPREVITAAVDLVRAGRPGRVVLAMPTAPQELIDDLARVTGDVVVATVAPWVEWFHWHGHLYEDDRVPSGEQVTELLAR